MKYETRQAFLVSEAPLLAGKLQPTPDHLSAVLLEKNILNRKSLPLITSYIYMHNVKYSAKWRSGSVRGS